MKTIQSHLPKSAQQAFGSTKSITINGFTIKYYFSKNEGHIVYLIYKGKGSGSQIASTPDYNEAVLFTSTPVEYKLIINTLNQREGAAWFKKGTSEMFFNEHPFKNNFRITTK